MCSTPVANPSTHWLYIARCANDALYTGYATDVERRIAVHNNGKGARYTRDHGPVQLVGCWQCDSKAEALRLERAIKRLHRKQKLALLAASQHPRETVCVRHDGEPQ